jgi:hypothetical protein
MVTKYAFLFWFKISPFAGLRIALAIELGVLICIVAFCFARRRTRTHRRQYILKRKQAFSHHRVFPF